MYSGRARSENSSPTFLCSGTASWDSYDVGTLELGGREEDGDDTDDTEDTKETEETGEDDTEDTDDTEGGDETEGTEKKEDIQDSTFRLRWIADNICQ